MPLQKQCEPRLAASDAQVPGSHGVGFPPDLDSFTLPTLPHSLLGFITSIVVSTTKKELDEERSDALFEDYGIMVGLLALR